MNENHACGAIMAFERIRRSFCLPRYTPPDWWECDVFELTKADRFREYEVKLSLADFKNDANKDREIGPHRWGKENREYEKKHDLLSRGDPRGPTQFWFVTPAGLIPQILLPNWAGLMELLDRGEGHRPSQRWTLAERVKAPKLHEAKIKPEVRQYALGACYYRFHDMLRTINDRGEPPTLWLDEPPPMAELEPTALVQNSTIGTV